MYLQLYERIKQDILSETYAYGKKLPSKRVLAAEENISVAPVEHALGLLYEEGYIEPRERSGYFVTYKKSDFQTKSGAPVLRNVFTGNAHSAKSEFPYSVFAKTVRKVLLDYNDTLLVKSPNRGTPELRRAIAEYLARSSGVVARPEQIIIGSGAEYLYGMIMQLLGKQRTYAIENPSYEIIRRVYEANGLQFEALKMGADGIRTSELNRTKATILHVTPFNSFPSGVTASASKRCEYLRWAKERNGFIIEDNYDSELTVSTKFDDTLFSLGGQERVVYLNTFSQTVAPSIRVGYMVLPLDMLAEFEKKLGFYSCTVPVLEQYVLAQLISDGNFERHINRVRRARRKKMRVQAAKEAGRDTGNEE